MRWPPVVAGVVALGVGALLVLSGEEARQPPDEAPGPTTSTTFPRESPHLRWRIGSEDRQNFQLSSVYDLERQATITRLRRLGGSGSASLQLDRDLSGRAGETLRFSAWLQVSGSASAWLWMQVIGHDTDAELRLDELRRHTVELAQLSTQDQPLESGRWERREIELVVPERAVVAFFGIHLEGDGALSVGDVVDP